MTPPEAWAHLPFFRQTWPILHQRLIAEADWLPGPDLIFAALDRVAPSAARVIVLGQDPYPTPGHATGLAFSVGREIKLPRSLKNIFAELQDDIGAAPPNGDLGVWADQGMLLLNTTLTVPEGRAGGHADWGWHHLARQVIAEAQQFGNLAFVLWGAQAQKAVSGLPRPTDLVVASAHPSPLSARRGFFGSRPFSRVNAWLQNEGHAPIRWA